MRVFLIGFIIAAAAIIHDSSLDHHRKAIGEKSWMRNVTISTIEESWRKYSLFNPGIGKYSIPLKSLRNRNRTQEAHPSLINDSFFECLHLAENESVVFEQAKEWYRQYLTLRVQDSWPLFSLLTDLPRECAVSDQSARIVTAVLCEVIRTLDIPNVALTDISDHLHNSRLFHSVSIDRAEAYQLLFAVLGWLSLLWNSKIDLANRSVFHIHIPVPRAAKNLKSRQELHLVPAISSSTRQRSKIFASSTASTDYYDRPVAFVVNSFGNLVPRPVPQPHAVHAFDSDATTLSWTDVSWIDVSQVCFQTLHRVGAIQLEFVDALSLHLAFDTRTRVLSVFKFPSLVLLMLLSNTTTVNDRLHVDSTRDGDNSELFCPPVERNTARQFFREVLLSYRVIFGQTKNSSRAFNKWYSKEFESDPCADPLIHIVCGQGWETREALGLYDQVCAHVPDPLNQYSPSHDFPFLGSRFLELQSYIQNQSPTTLGALWRNDTNKRAWWVVWLIFIIGSSSILLGMMQVMWSIFQVLAAIDSPGPHTQPTPGPPNEDSPRNNTRDSGQSYVAPQTHILTTFTIILWVVIITIMVTSFWPQLTAMFKSCQEDQEPIGRCRVHWNCYCGKKLQDDFLEIVPGAASRFSLSIEADGPTESESLPKQLASDIESQSTISMPSTFPSPTTWKRLHSWLSGLISSPKVDQTEPSQISENETKERESSDPTEPLYLLVCIERSNGSIGLIQEDVSDIISDCVLFSRLRERYTAARGRWLPRLSLKRLQAIKFVQFELWASGEVEVMQFFDRRMIPPPSKTNEYRFSPPEVIPPIGSGRLMHFWNSPNHPDNNMPTCLLRFPKKMRERLCVDASGTPAKGWGIHLVEGNNWALIMILFITISLLGSLVFGVSFAIMHHNIQNAFAMASMVIGMAAFTTSTCSICCRRMTGSHIS